MSSSANIDPAKYQAAQSLLMQNFGGEPETSENIQDQNIQRKQNLIPPVGIAYPELVSSFMQNPLDEEKVLKDVADLESYHRETPLQTAGREVSSYGLRALEGLGGTIGGLMNLLSADAAFDDEGNLLENVPRWPSSSELREFTKEKTGKKFEPKTPFAKEAHEAITDVGAAAPLPGGWFSKVLIPILGQGVKALAKHQGASESQGDMAKLGFMTAATIANIGNAPQMARNAYNEAVNMIRPGTRMQTRVIENGLNTLRNQPWYRTGRTTAKGPAFDEMQRIEDAIQHGSMDVHDAMQIRRDINEARKKLGAFNYEPGIDKAAARQHLDRVDEVLRDGLENYGSKNNPKWLNSYERANQAYAVTQRSRQLQDYIQANALTKGLQSQTAKLLFNLGAGSALIKMPALAIPTAGAFAGAKGIQVINRMVRSPLLRNYYGQVLAAASAQNAGAMNNALKRLDEEAKKMESGRRNVNSPNLHRK